jgi:hypothetical protein
MAKLKLCEGYGSFRRSRNSVRGWNRWTASGGRVAKVLFTNGHFITFSTASNSLALNIVHIIINLSQLWFPAEKHLYNGQVLVGSLVGCWSFAAVKGFWPYGIIFMNVCVVTIAMVMLLRDFGPYGIIFMTMYVHYFRFFHHSWQAIYCFFFIFSWIFTSLLNATNGHFKSWQDRFHFTDNLIHQRYTEKRYWFQSDIFCL